MKKSDVPLLSTFNNEVYGSVIQWCTPSIHMEVPRIQAIYENDISVSYHSLGNPCTNTGVFKTAHELAAKAYGADYTLFSVNGSTGSNFIVLRALKHQLGKVKLLAQRNVHKSIGAACEDYQIDVVYLQPHYNNDLQIFVPNTVEEIVAGVQKHKPDVLLISNPTYEGLSLYLPDLVKAVRKADKNVIIFIDEAWGAHFPFSDKLPVSAMQAGADICVQSTHKQGSGLQQTSMIHWNKGRIQYDVLLDSYKALTTTSPSYHLLASLDGARYFMQERGEETINKLAEMADHMRSQLNKIVGVHAYEPRDLMRAAGAGRMQVDPTKILVRFDGYSAMEIAERLEHNHKIVVEKYESNSILFIMKFQNTMSDIAITIRALKTELRSLERGSVVKFPDFPVTIEKAMIAYKVPHDSESVVLSKAIGRVIAENVIPYPPGIPMIAKGERIGQEHVNYLKALKKTNGLITVIMNDPTITKLRVVKE